MQEFTALDLCRIIKCGAVNGVARLTIGDFQVNYYHPPAASLGPQVTADPPNVTEFPAPPASEQPPEVTIADPELLEDLRMSQLMISDPLAFEQEIIDSHLEEARGADGQAD